MGVAGRHTDGLFRSVGKMDLPHPAARAEREDTSTG